MDKLVKRRKWNWVVHTLNVRLAIAITCKNIWKELEKGSLTELERTLEDTVNELEETWKGLEKVRIGLHSDSVLFSVAQIILVNLVLS